MLNLVDLLPHFEKDNTVESKESKATALNELVELRSCLPFSSHNGGVEAYWKSSEGFASYPHLFHLTLIKCPLEELISQISCSHNGTAQKSDHGDLKKMTVVEVGPRFCSNPIRIVGGSFGSPTSYENLLYHRTGFTLEKRQKAGKYANKVKAKTRKKMHELENPLKADELTDV